MNGNSKILRLKFTDHYTQWYVFTAA